MVEKKLSISSEKCPLTLSKYESNIENVNTHGGYNREEKQLMNAKSKTGKAKLYPERCDGNPWCPSMRACPTGAIKVKESKGFIIKKVTLELEEDKCTGCGKCVKYCAHGAIKIQ